MADARTGSGLGLLKHLVASMALWGATTVIAARVLSSDPASAALRASMVALPMAGLVYWIWVLTRVIGSHDEFSRRIHLIALAVAYGLTAFLTFAAMFLQMAGFIDYVSLPTMLATMVATWWLSLLVTTRYYR
jgi:hypothetical protein